MENFSKYAINFILIGLFTVALFSWAFNVANDYDMDESIMKSDKFDYDSVEEQIEGTSEDAQAWSDKFTSDNPLLSSGSLVLFAIWGVTKLVWTSVTSIFNLLFGGISNVLGIPVVVTGVLSSILIILLIFSAWRLIKAGE